MTKDRDVEIAGLKVKVVPDEGLAERMVAERGIMACVRAEAVTPFGDNKVGSCIACESGVQYRPFMPEGVAKVCTTCLTTFTPDEVQAKADAFYEGKTR